MCTTLALVGLLSLYQSCPLGTFKLEEVAKPLVGPILPTSSAPPTRSSKWRLMPLDIPKQPPEEFRLKGLGLRYRVTF